MPQRLPLRSLKTICKESVIRNIGSFCSEHGNDGPSPFKDLPSELVCELLVMLRENGLHMKEYLSLLIVPHLEHLDLTGMASYNSVTFCLKLASKRCPITLKSLKLNSYLCESFASTNFVRLSCFAKLRNLCMSRSSCSDKTLFVVGANCPDLKELDVSFCPVSDAGIEALCLDGICPVNPELRVGRCLQLQKLLLRGTPVSQAGILTALENLPQLRILESSLSVVAIANSHRIASQSGQNPLQYKLLSLHHDRYHSAEYSPLSLPLAIRGCPSVVRICLQYCASISDEDLLALIHLKHLREFELALKSSQRKATFLNGIIPILQAHELLESLQIGGINHVNLEVIASLCQHLATFSVVGGNTYTTTWPNRLPKPTTIRPLPLHSLHIKVFVRAGLPINHLKYLWSSPTLIHVSLRNFRDLSDIFFRNILRMNHFPNLESLKMIASPSVTLKTLMAFLKLKNPMKTLTFISQEYSRSSDAFALVTKFVQEERLELEIEYSRNVFWNDS